jgi:small-conductance mechanosensitive channel
MAATPRAPGPPSTVTPGESGPEEVLDLVPLLVDFAWFLLGLVVVVAVGWFVVEPLVGRVVRRRNRENPTIQEAIELYVRVLFVGLGTIVGVAVAGYGQLLGNSALIVAAGTLAVGVAAQTVLGSLVSGLVLVFDPEFSVGNYIEWGDYEGTVQSIQLRATRVETPGGDLVTVPNTELTSEVIVRPYGRERHRLTTRVAVDYEEDLADVLQYAIEAAADVDAVVDEPAPTAYVDEIGAGVVFVDVHYWLERPRPTDVLEARSAYTAAVKTRLSSEDVSVSPPSEHELGGHLTVDRRE